MGQSRIVATDTIDIVNGFRGACGRLIRSGQEQAVLWLLVDHILIYVQEPIYVTLGKRSGGRIIPRFSSLSAQDRRFLGLVPLEHEKMNDESDRILLHDEKKQLAVLLRCLPADKSPRSPEDIINVVRHREGGIRRLLAVKRDLVLSVLDWYEPESHEYWIDNDRVDEDALSRAVERSDDFLKPIRAGIGLVLDSLGRTELTESPSEGLMNLFAVARRPSTNRVVIPPSGYRDIEREAVTYSYTAGLILSEKQTDVLKSRGISCSELEKPLPSGMRSIADTPLAQGNIDFGIPNERLQHSGFSRQYYGEASNDTKLRLSGESALIQTHTDDATGSEEIFYIPIHIGGLPWIALFTLNDPGDEGRFLRNYLLYRDLIPLLSESTSLAMQTAFSDAIAQTVTSSFFKLRGVRSFLDTANRELADISLFYPYPTVKLDHEGYEEEKLYLEGEGLGYDIYLRLGKNRGSLGYRLLDPGLLRRNITQRLQGAIDHQRGEYKEALFIFGHHAGKLFQESGLPGLNLSTYPDLAHMRSRLFLAWGMSAAIRPLKNPGGKLPKDWFPSGFFDEPWTPDLHLIMKAIIGICRFYAAGISQDLRPDWKIRLFSQGAITEWTVGELSRIGSPPLPNLPPLNSIIGSAGGTLALTIGIAEIMRNAGTHLNLYARSFDIGISEGDLDPYVLEIEVESPHKKSCSVTVRNVCRLPSNPRSDTIAGIQQLERTALTVDGAQLVETDQPTLGDEITKHFGWVQCTWTYRYSYFGDR